MTSRLKRLVIAGTAAVTLLMTAAGCSGMATDATQQGIRYSGGSLDVEKFKNCQTGPARDYGDPGDHLYYYPAAQRTFAFTDNPAAKPDAAAISVLSSNQQNLTVRGIATFTMTTDCEKLRKFHELVGKRMNASFPEGAQEDDDGGWAQFLATYFNRPVNAIADTAAVKYTWQQLGLDASVTAKLEAEMTKGLAAEINSKIGDGVIVVNGVDLERPEPPKELLDALKASEAAKADGNARVAKVEADRRVAEQQTELAREQARAAAQCRTVYDANECMVLELAKDDQLKNYNPNGKLVLQQQQ